jgi:hypothetical protein
VDVYSDWVDACDAVAKTTANKYDNTDSRALDSHESPVSPSGDLGKDAMDAPFDDDY